jgi:lysylphosphatidylglycerol synthetase-like protein (DUF2156 family)
MHTHHLGGCVFCMLQCTVMKKQFLAVFLLTFVLYVPIVALAANGLDNPGGNDPGTLVPSCEGSSCKFAHLVQLANNVLNLLVNLSIMAAALMFAYAGFLYMSDGGNMTKVKEAHTVFTSVAVGIIIVLIAWLSIDTLLNTLTGKGLKEWSSEAYNIQIERNFS